MDTHSSAPRQPDTLQVFYDGACPLCSREITWLRRKMPAGEVEFVDIAAPGFDASKQGLLQAELMQEIHARRPDGTVLRGMEVFRHIYRYLPLGFLLQVTGWPVLKPLFDFLYKTFARNRLRLTGRACDKQSCS